MNSEPPAAACAHLGCTGSTERRWEPCSSPQASGSWPPTPLPRPSPSPLPGGRQWWRRCAPARAEGCSCQSLAGARQTPRAVWAGQTRSSPGAPVRCSRCQKGLGWSARWPSSAGVRQTHGTSAAGPSTHWPPAWSAPPLETHTHTQQATPTEGLSQGITGSACRNCWSACLAATFSSPLPVVPATSPRGASRLPPQAPASDTMLAMCRSFHFSLTWRRRKSATWGDPMLHGQVGRAGRQG